MLEYLGPYLALNEENQPASWVCYVKEGKTIQFHRKGLEEGARYEPFDMLGSEPFYALGAGNEIMIFFQHNTQIYKAIRGAYGINYTSLLNNTKINQSKFNSSPPTFKDFQSIQAEEFLTPYLSISAEALQQEFNTPQEEMRSDDVAEVVDGAAAIETPATNIYNLDAVIARRGRELTPTEELVVESLRLYWGIIFESIHSRDELDFACKAIFAKEVEKARNIQLFNDAFQLRMAFLIPDQIAQQFPPELRIDDVCNFVKDLVLFVYHEEFTDEVLSYELPQSAFQTVAVFNQRRQEPDGDVYEGDEEFARSIQVDFDAEMAQRLDVILNGPAEHVAGNGGAPEELDVEFNGTAEPLARNEVALDADVDLNDEELLARFRQSLKDRIFPAARGDLNLIWKIWEWFSNWCAILDIYCCQLGTSAAILKEHTNLSHQDKTVSNSIFSNGKSYDENVRDEIIDLLKKGRG